MTFNRTHYFIDKGQERGLAYESLKLFENDLNTELKTGNLKVHVAVSYTHLTLPTILLV